MLFSITSAFVHNIYTRCLIKFAFTIVKLKKKKRSWVAKGHLGMGQHHKPACDHQMDLRLKEPNWWQALPGQNAKYCKMYKYLLNMKCIQISDLQDWQAEWRRLVLVFWPCYQPERIVNKEGHLLILSGLVTHLHHLDKGTYIALTQDL